MKNKFFYIIGLILMASLLLTLMYMQPEFSEDYLTKFTLAIVCIGIITALLEILLFRIYRKHRKGPVFLLCRPEDKDFMLKVKLELNKSGCLCYPTCSANNLTTYILDNEIHKSRLLVVLLSEDTPESPYFNYVLKTAKKQKRKNILCFSITPDYKVPSQLKHIFPITVEHTPEGASLMAHTITANLSLSY